MLQRDFKYSFGFTGKDRDYFAPGHSIKITLLHIVLCQSCMCLPVSQQMAAFQYFYIEDVYGRLK